MVKQTDSRIIEGADNLKRQVDQYFLETLCEIKEKYAPAMERIGRIDEKLEEAMESYIDGICDDKRILPVVQLMNAYRLAMKIERKEMRYFQAIKDELVSRNLYEPDEIALDINELLASKGNVRVLIGPIDYRAYYHSDMLSNLELVWSSVSLTALLHPSNLKNLRYVMGDFRVGHLTEPLHVEVTGGWSDLKKLNDPKMLPDYRLALGDVYVSHSSSLMLEEILGDLHITDDDQFEGLPTKLNRLDGQLYLPKVSEGAIDYKSFQKTKED